MKFDLEINNVIKRIKKEKSKLVCIQLPDGLKPKAEIIKKEIENKTNAEVVVWMGSCFGACDIPLEIKRLKVDLLIQWGHSVWKY